MIRRGRHSADYSQIPNSTANDERLSFEARGVLLYLLSKPEDWIIQITDLCRNGNIGRDKAYRILRELKEAGYLIWEQNRSENGQMAGRECVVHDLPIGLQREPLPENEDTAQPCPENPTHTKDIKITKDRVEDSSSEEIDQALSEYLAIAEQMGLPKISKLTGKRRSHLSARLKEHGLAMWVAAMRAMPDSKFLSGRNDRGWKPDFDWLVKPDNFAKLIEGKYHGGEPVRPEPAPRAGDQPDLLASGESGPPRFSEADAHGWEQRLTDLYEIGIWRGEYGPWPGVSGCMVPEAILNRWRERLETSGVWGRPR